MALIKSYQVVTGETGNYWRIIQWQGDANNDSTAVLLGLYVNEDFRKANQNVVLGNTFQLTIPGTHETREAIYTELKNIGIFTDAIDG